VSCTRAQEFLGRENIETVEQVNAKQIKIGLDEAVKLASKVNDLYVLKGTKVVHVDLKKQKPSREELGKLLMGPTGNLRAPTIIKGNTLLVGFNQETYEKVLVD
jgi:arsenate reductase-like glutaredoxin family protein